jgi:hypothetical protein
VLGRLPLRVCCRWALARELVRSSAPVSVVSVRAILSSLGDWVAGTFSAAVREPSFHQGLLGPSLRSVLWRGMSYPWGLQALRVGPSSIRMLTSDLFSPSASVLILRTVGATDQ